MNTYLECIPCFFKQALHAAREATKDELKVKQVLDRIAELVPCISMESPPPETARLIYGAVREVTGVFDPFYAQKSRNIETALSLYDGMKASVKRSEDPLLEAIKIAIAGNAIDLGANPEFDPEKDMKNILGLPFSTEHYEAFRNSIDQARTILYLGDNAGETVFDRILIETMNKDTVYAVRHIPIINDATIEDAEKSGIHDVARIVSSGCDAPGTILERCSMVFLDIFRKADLIISKGQGNYESLSSEKGPIYFLLKVKCRVVAQRLGKKNDEMYLGGSP